MTRAEKASAIRNLMQTEGPSVAQNTQGFNAGRYESVGRLKDYDALKERAREIKEESIERLPSLIGKLREQIESRGGTVYLADDAADANAHIAELTAGADRLVKSKSMTSEELEVNEHLEEHGIEVVETDLGEWVLQVAAESPSHIVAPAIHKSRQAIAELFNRQFDPPTLLETAEELTQFAREKLGRLIEGADVGMTGANFITADSGTVALVTSEGNARKSALVPPTYIAVAGVEKIIPRVEDLQPFIELIGRSGTGQDITSYVSLLTPPFESPPLDFDSPDTPAQQAERDFHLVLIDNGRMAMRDDPQLKETLYCIRCGACSNSCANFQQVGGHAFGGETYSGGIGTGWEAGIHGLDSAASFNDFCTGCSRCVPACPVNIDIPWINVVVRDRINRAGETNLDALADGLRPNGETDGSPSLRKRAFANFERLAKLGSRTAPVSNWVNRRSTVRSLFDWALGIDRRRPLPEFQREKLRDWFVGRDAPSSRNSTDSVVLYPDLYTNYVRTDRGKAAVRVLEALGVTVEMPDVPGSGRAPLSQGMISAAERKAEAVWDVLKGPVEAGRDVVVIEPTDLAMFHRRYGKLLPSTSAAALRDATYDVMDYVSRLIEEGKPVGELRQGGGECVAYHSHCQQRTLELEGPTVDVLEALGYEVESSSVECCGMAGSFGYKSEYYELSMEVGSELRDEFEGSGSEAATVVASGTSCQEQLESLFDTSVQHPIQLLDPTN